MKLFDSHAHLDIDKSDVAEIEAMLKRAWDQDLIGIVAISGATKPGDFEVTAEIAARHRRVFIAAGIHPHTATYATHDNLDKLRFVLDKQNAVALGEIGLDYHYNYSPPSEQRRAFARQIKMAHKAQLPIIVHTRKADEDTVAILQDEGASEAGGVIHCFSSDIKLATKVLDMGFYISFSGIVTFPKADDVQEVALKAPLDRILAETDTPFLSPIPKRGQINEPANVRYVVEKLAEIRGLEPEKMAQTTVNNTMSCFRIEKHKVEDF